MYSEHDTWNRQPVSCIPGGPVDGAWREALKEEGGGVSLSKGRDGMKCPHPIL